MTAFAFEGPPRYAHQREGLKKMVETGGRCALLFDPGMGKTATVIDYVGLLALKSPRQEARVLVIAPLAAIDTWVDQVGTYGSKQVGWWAEALQGPLLDRAVRLADRGGNPYPKRPGGKELRPSKHRRARDVVSALASRAQHPGGEKADRTWGPEGVRGPRAVVLSVNLETFSSRATVGSKTMADVILDAVTRFDPDLLVVDESHKIKSPTSNVSRLLARVSAKVPRRVLLTGTVMPHSPMDVFAQWRVMEPTAFGPLRTDGTRAPATFGQFKARYAQTGGWMGKEIVGFQRLSEMQDKMALNSVVARKETALDLPKTTEVIVPVHLSPAEDRAYREMRDQLATQLDSGRLASTPNRLAQMMRLRQITAGHLPDDSGIVHQIGRSKALTVKSIVNDTLAGEKRVVVFALFRHEIDSLVAELDVKGTRVDVITGDTSGEERRLIRKRFASTSEERIVLVAQVKTVSIAINELVSASHAVFASLSQQRDDLVQARDRLDRIGQTRPVTYWMAVAPGTVDGVILDAHRGRDDLEAAMLRHIQGV